MGVLGYRPPFRHICWAGLEGRIEVRIGLCRQLTYHTIDELYDTCQKRLAVFGVNMRRRVIYSGASSSYSPRDRGYLPWDLTETHPSVKILTSWLL